MLDLEPIRALWKEAIATFPTHEHASIDWFLRYTDAIADIPALIAEVERQRDQIEWLKDAVEFCAVDHGSHVAQKALEKLGEA